MICSSIRLLHRLALGAIVALVAAPCSAEVEAQSVAPPTDTAVAAAPSPSATTAIEPPAEAAAPEASVPDADIIQTPVVESSEVQFGNSIATRYKDGAKILAKGGTVRDIRIMVAVPLECPEQEVHVVEEDFSPNVESVDFRTLPDDKRATPGARQMLITLSQLAPRQEAHALVTYDVVTKTVLPPTDTASLKIPAKPDRTIKPYLSTSPFINVGHRKIRDAVKEALSKPKDAPASAEAAVDATSEEPSASTAAYEEVGADSVDSSALAKPKADKTVSKNREAAKEASTDSEPTVFQTGELGNTEESSASEATGDWEKVEAIYDFVQNKVKYQEGAQDKSALDALQEGKGDCHGISALFVAMCRTAKVPARMVWVDEHQYAEFYLEDAEGKGHWYPVQSAGTRAFGEMPTPKVILQKGDNFRVPERRRERLRYASDYTMLLSAPQYKPKVTYIREQL